MHPIRSVSNAELELEHLLRRVDRVVAGAQSEAANPEIVSLCQEANELANRLRQQITGASNPDEERRLRNEGFRWIRDKTNQWRRRMRSLSVADLDGLNGCIARVAHAVAQQPRRLRTFQERSQRRMSRSVMPSRIRRRP
jgi:hypothetical protein